MKRGKVFVRARHPHAGWARYDVLDLDEPSFRAFILHTLVSRNLVITQRDDQVDDPREITYSVRPETKVQVDSR